MSPTTKQRPRRNRYRDELEMANGCLDMVREELEHLGLPMKGCPPMFYNDAIRNLAVILGRAAHMETLIDMQRHVAEYESGHSEPLAGPQQENP